MADIKCTTSLSFSGVPTELWNALGTWESSDRLSRHFDGTREGLRFARGATPSDTWGGRGIRMVTTLRRFDAPLPIALAAIGHQRSQGKNLLIFSRNMPRRERVAV